MLVGVARAEQLIDLQKLKALKMGQAVSVNEVLDRQADAVCVVPPFMTEVYDDVPFRDLVNTYLKTAKFNPGGENEWVLVAVRGATVTTQQIRGSRDGVYLATGHQFQLPKTFKPVGCATSDRAQIIKSSERTVSLGEDR